MHRIPLWSVLVLLVPLAAAAQDIPPYVPANPLLESRSALYGQSYISAAHRAGRFASSPTTTTRWRCRRAPGANLRQSIFDAEVLQADLWVTHDLSPHVFVLANLPLRGAYSGFLDGFLIWYHHLIGLARAGTR